MSIGETGLMMDAEIFIGMNENGKRKRIYIRVGANCHRFFEEWFHSISAPLMVKEEEPGDR